MLEPGQHDLVTRLEEAAAIAAGNQVDGFGRAAGKHDLPRLTGIEEAAHLLPRRLIGEGSSFAQPVDAAMDVGVLRLIGMADGIDDRLRLLRAGSAVEEDQPLATHWARQNREIRPHALE